MAEEFNPYALSQRRQVQSPVDIHAPVFAAAVLAGDKEGQFAAFVFTEDKVGRHCGKHIQGAVYWESIDGSLLMIYIGLTLPLYIAK